MEDRWGDISSSSESRPRENMERLVEGGGGAARPAVDRWVEKGGGAARPVVDRWVEVTNLEGEGALLPGPTSPSQELSRESIECWVEEGAGSWAEEGNDALERGGEEGGKRWLGERLPASLAMCELLSFSLARVEELLSTSLAIVEELLASVEELLSTSLAIVKELLSTSLARVEELLSKSLEVSFLPPVVSSREVTLLFTWRSLGGGEIGAAGRGPKSVSRSSRSSSSNILGQGGA